MKLEDFYQAIRYPTEPKSFAEIEDRIDQTTYALATDKKITDGTHYHLNVFKENGDDKTLFLHFNIAAFIFGPLWFIYRGLHIFAIFLVLAMLSSFVPSIADLLNSELWTWSYLSFMVFSGMFGNSLYIMHVKSRWKRGKKTPRNEILPAVLIAFHFLIFVTSTVIAFYKFPI